MSLPKTDDNDRTHKNGSNTLCLHMVNASIWTSSSYDQFKTLVLESRKPCASSNTVLLEEINLLPIIDWLF